MKWVKLDGEGYFDGYKCSVCETIIVVADDCELPDYCKFCERAVDEDKVQWLKEGECPMTPEQFNAIYDDEMVGEDNNSLLVDNRK